MEASDLSWFSRRGRERRRKRERAGALNTCPSVGKTCNCRCAGFKTDPPLLHILWLQFIELNKQQMYSKWQKSAEQRKQLLIVCMKMTIHFWQSLTFMFFCLFLDMRINISRFSTCKCVMHEISFVFTAYLMFDWRLLRKKVFTLTFKNVSTIRSAGPRQHQKERNTIRICQY